MDEDQKYTSNFTPYGYEGSENFTNYYGGESMNAYSGIYDMIINANIEHEGWQEGYDY